MTRIKFILAYNETTGRIELWEQSSWGKFFVCHGARGGYPEPQFFLSESQILQGTWQSRIKLDQWIEQKPLEECLI